MLADLECPVEIYGGQSTDRAEGGIKFPQKDCKERRWRVGGPRWSFWREIVRVSDLSRLKDIFQVFDHLVIFSRSEERK